MLAGVERFAGHLKQSVEGASLTRRPFPVVSALRAMLLRRFPLELLLLLLLLLLQGRVMEAGVYTVMQTVMVVSKGVRTSGIGDGASAGRRGAAERWLADGAGHGRQGHTHERQVPGRGGMVVMMMMMQVVMLMVRLLLLLLMKMVTVMMVI